MTVVSSCMGGIVASLSVAKSAGRCLCSSANVLVYPCTLNNSSVVIP